MTRNGIRVGLTKIKRAGDQEGGGGLSRVCPASGIIRARARVIDPVKLGVCVRA